MIDLTRNTVARNIAYGFSVAMRMRDLTVDEAWGSASVAAAIEEEGPFSVGELADLIRGDTELMRAVRSMLRDYDDKTSAGLTVAVKNAAIVKSAITHLIKQGEIF